MTFRYLEKVKTFVNKTDFISPLNGVKLSPTVDLLALLHAVVEITCRGTGVTAV